MSPWMITGSQYDAEGDSIGYFGDAFPAIARSRIEVVPGLGFLPGAIVDQHFLRRERAAGITVHLLPAGSSFDPRTGRARIH